MPGSIYSGTIADLPRESRFGGTYRRTGLVMDQCNMCFVWNDPNPLKDGETMDFEMGMHSHACDMMFIVMEGDYVWQLGDERRRIKKGDFVYIPRDMPHGGRNISTEEGYALEIFAPIRTDYLYVAEHQLAQHQASREDDGARVDKRSIAEAAAQMGDMTLHPPRR